MGRDMHAAIPAIPDVNADNSVWSCLPVKSAKDLRHVCKIRSDHPGDSLVVSVLLKFGNDRADAFGHRFVVLISGNIIYSRSDYHVAKRAQVVRRFQKTAEPKFELCVPDVVCAVQVWRTRDNSVGVE